MVPNLLIVKIFNRVIKLFYYLLLILKHFLQLLLFKQSLTDLTFRYFEINEQNIALVNKDTIFQIHLVLDFRDNSSSEAASRGNAIAVQVKLIARVRMHFLIILPKLELPNHNFFFSFFHVFLQLVETHIPNTNMSCRWLFSVSRYLLVHLVYLLLENFYLFLSFFFLFFQLFLNQSFVSLHLFPSFPLFLCHQLVLVFIISLIQLRQRSAIVIFNSIFNCL